MKITSVVVNNRKRAFECVLDGGEAFPMPYAALDPRPETTDPVVEAFVDEELGSECFTYRTRSGAEGSVHLDAVLEYNKDPAYLRELLVHRLTVEVLRCLAVCGLSHRELIRRTGTSPSQFYRLLDTTNTTKSIDKLIVLLGAMHCDVDFTVDAPCHVGE